MSNSIAAQTTSQKQSIEEYLESLKRLGEEAKARRLKANQRLAELETANQPFTESIDKDIQEYAKSIAKDPEYYTPSIHRKITDKYYQLPVANCWIAEDQLCVQFGDLRYEHNQLQWPLSCPIDSIKPDCDQSLITEYTDTYTSIWASDWALAAKFLLVWEFFNVRGN